MVTVLNKLKISFKQAFAMVMTVSMLCALLLTWVISSSLVSLQQNKDISYQSNSYTVYEKEYSNEQAIAIPETQKSYRFITTINTWLPLILFFLSTVLASFLFYRWKMKTPLSLLNTSIQKINDKELDFSIQYDARDEMGDLIRTFESMRKELYMSYTSQWRAQEDSKILHAAFAHDIRTPLTVLKGQVDVLLRNVKMNRVDQQKIIETLSLLTRHINRIENYTDEMSALQRLEEICISKKAITWTSFWVMLQKNLAVLAETGGKTIQFNCNVSTNIICMDESVITRVAENVVSNAVRYAAASIIMNIEESAGNLIIEVCDDGSGFSTDSLQHALEPFYHESSPHSQNPTNGLGLGLYICKTLVEKHGGSIVLSNGYLDGGCVILKLISVF